MLNILSKISYKFSTNAIFILFSIISDILLSNEEFGKFTIIMAIQILIFNFVDVFNIKFLLGEFSKKIKKKAFNKYFKIKIFYGLIFTILLSCVYYIYDVDIFLICILLLTNYIQLLTSTISTYIFANEKNLTLFKSNFISFLFSGVFLLTCFIYNSLFIREIIISIFIYRIVELIYLLIVSKKYFIKSKATISKNDLQEVSPFYFQLLLSIGSTKLFLLFLPTFISYEKIAIIGTYEYILAIPLFFISILTMNLYSNLFKLDLDSRFEKTAYDNILKNYYKKSILLIVFFIGFQLTYINFVKPEMYEYLKYLLVNNFVVVFSAIQGYLLFFWKMNAIIIYISIFVLLMKNTIMLYLILKFGLDGFFVFSLLLEISVVIFIRNKINLLKGLS